MGLSMPVRAAVVGAGWAGALHAEALFDTPGVELSAVCDREHARAAALAARYGAIPYTDLSRLLAEVRPRLVCVATPTQAHAPCVRLALESGADVLCEKPLAESGAAARELAAIAARSGHSLSVAFNQRLAGGVRFARERLAADGSRLLTITVSQVERVPLDPAAIPAEFLVTDGVIHAVDLVQHLGGPIVAVTAVTRSRYHYITEMVATIELESGAIGTLLYAHAGPGNSRHPIHQVEIVTEAQRIQIDNLCDGAEAFPADAEAAVHWRPYLFARRDYPASVIDGVRAWAEAIRDGQPTPLPAADGVRAQFVTDALLESARTGRRVLVEPSEA